MTTAFNPKANVATDEQSAAVRARVEAAANGTGPPIQIGSHTLGPGATPQQIDEASKMLGYRDANPTTNWSTSETLTKLARGGAKAMAGAGIIAGGMTLAGVGYGAGAAGAGAGAAPAAAGAVTAPNGMLTGAMGAAGGGAGTMAGAVPAAGAGAATKAGLLSRVGSFLGKNKDLVGMGIEGVSGAMADEADHDQSIELLRERDRIEAAKYGNANPGNTYRGLMPGAKPSASYDLYAGHEYRWDPRTQSIVKAPAQPV